VEIPTDLPSGKSWRGWETSSSRDCPLDGLGIALVFGVLMMRAPSVLTPAMLQVELLVLLALLLITRRPPSARDIALVGDPFELRPRCRLAAPWFMLGGVVMALPPWTIIGIWHNRSHASMPVCTATLRVQ